MDSLGSKVPVAFAVGMDIRILMYATLYICVCESVCLCVSLSHLSVCVYVCVCV
jgi:hypothetical protein